jgi:hypothetical protein
MKRLDDQARLIDGGTAVTPEQFARGVARACGEAALAAGPSRTIDTAGKLALAFPRQPLR